MQRQPNAGILRAIQSGSISIAFSRDAVVVIGAKRELIFPVGVRTQTATDGVPQAQRPLTLPPCFSSFQRASANSSRSLTSSHESAP